MHGSKGVSLKELAFAELEFLNGVEWRIVQTKRHWWTIIEVSVSAVTGCKLELPSDAATLIPTSDTWEA